ncbi:hypothetical protein YPPY03_0041, partial [Yersinia pestis PY-03]
MQRAHPLFHYPTQAAQVSIVSP